MPRRGRPPKFGRRSQLLALTLPHDVIAQLKAIDDDPAWAIVRLVEQRAGAAPRPPAETETPPDVELLPVGSGRFLIVVRADAFEGLDTASLIPLGAGRAFLAFELGRTLDVLELSILDRLERPGLSDPKREKLAMLRTQLKVWRLDPTLTFHERSIVVGERKRRRPAARRRV